MAEVQNHKTTNHEEIKHWAEERDAQPAIVKGDSSVLRFTFPDTDSEELDEIEWDTFFDIFEQNELALVYQDKTSDGEVSRFNKLVHR